MRLWYFGLCLTFAATSTIMAATPEEVVKKAIDAHGGDKVLTKFKAGTADIKGEIQTEFGKSAFTGTMAYEIPDKYRMVLNLDVGGVKVAIMQLVNGDTVKMTVNGMAQPLPETQKKEALAASALQEIGQLTPLLDKKQYTLTAGKDDKVDGKPTEVVTVKGKKLDQIDLHFDAKSALLVKTVRTALSPEGKEVTEESLLSDYKKVEGVMSPEKLVVTHDGKPFMTMTMSNPKMFEKLDPKEFKSEGDDK